MIDAHRLAEERSLAFHRVIAERLETSPEILRMARARVAAWIAAAELPPWYALQWRAVLDGDLASIRGFLTERSERAVELRQSSPFAGALDARERWRLWRETGERDDAAR